MGGIKQITLSQQQVFVTNLVHFTNFNMKKSSQIWNISSGMTLNPIQDRGWGQKCPPTSLFLVTSTNVGFGPKNFCLLV